MDERLGAHGRRRASLASPSPSSSRPWRLHRLLRRRRRRSARSAAALAGAGGPSRVSALVRASAAGRTGAPSPCPASAAPRRLTAYGQSRLCRRPDRQASPRPRARAAAGERRRIRRPLATAEPSQAPTHPSPAPVVARTSTRADTSRADYPGQPTPSRAQPLRTGRPGAALIAATSSRRRAERARDGRRAPLHPSPAPTTGGARCLRACCAPPLSAARRRRLPPLIRRAYEAPIRIFGRGSGARRARRRADAAAAGPDAETHLRLAHGGGSDLRLPSPSLLVIDKTSAGAVVHYHSPSITFDIPFCLSSRSRRDNSRVASTYCPRATSAPSRAGTSPILCQCSNILAWLRRRSALVSAFGHRALRQPHRSLADARSSATNKPLRRYAAAAPCRRESARRSPAGFETYHALWPTPWTSTRPRNLLR